MDHRVPSPLDNSFMTIRHDRVIFHDGEMIPLFFPPTDPNAIENNDCISFLDISFHCNTHCLGSRFTSNPPVNNPLLMQFSFFLIDAENRALKPVTALNQNLVFVVMDPPPVPDSRELTMPIVNIPNSKRPYAEVSSDSPGDRGRRSSRHVKKSH